LIETSAHLWLEGSRQPARAGVPLKSSVPRRGRIRRTRTTWRAILLYCPNAGGGRRRRAAETRNAGAGSAGAEKRLMLFRPGAKWGNVNNWRSRGNIARSLEVPGKIAGRVYGRASRAMRRRATIRCNYTPALLAAGGWGPRGTVMRRLVRKSVAIGWWGSDPDGRGHVFKGFETCVRSREPRPSSCFRGGSDTGLAKAQSGRAGRRRTPSRGQEFLNGNLCTALGGTGTVPYSLPLFCFGAGP